VLVGYGGRGPTSRILSEGLFPETSFPEQQSSARNNEAVELRPRLRDRPAPVKLTKTDVSPCEGVNDALHAARRRLG
jgi:hypothetical protein